MAWGWLCFCAKARDRGIEAWRQCALAAPREQNQSEPAVPAPLRTELTMLLASMVLLNHQTEVVR